MQEPQIALINLLATGY